MSRVIIYLLFLCFALPTCAEEGSLESLLTGNMVVDDDRFYEKHRSEAHSLQAELHQYTLEFIRENRPRYKQLKDDEISLHGLHLPDSVLYELNAAVTILAASNSKEEFDASTARVKYAFKTLTDSVVNLPEQIIGLNVEETKHAFAVLAERDQELVLGLVNKKSERYSSFSEAESKSLNFLIRKFISNETYKHGNYTLKYLKEHGWPDPAVFGDEPSSTVFLVFQHLDSNLSLQKKMLPIVKKAVDNDMAKGSNYAYLYDRIKVNNGEKQLYGTQLNGCGLQPLEDPKDVDERRLTLNMESIESYLSRVPNCAGKDIKSALQKANITAT